MANADVCIMISHMSHLSSHKNMAFKWRHRFLKAQNHSKDQLLTGIAEIDEILLLESFKGQRKLPRAARKRSGVAKKTGVSAEQIPIRIA